MFLRDLISSVWEEAVPEKIKPFMLNMCDSFMMSYCLSRAMTTSNTINAATAATETVTTTSEALSVKPVHKELTSSVAFAQTVTYALVLSVALKTALEMSSAADYKYIYAIPDAVTRNVQELERHEAFLDAEQFKRNKIEAMVAAKQEEALVNGMLYNVEETAKIMKNNPSLVSVVFVSL